MDELLIEEKKYVSSKRAAKMTGYAKDYIGQLCREGRVPARLVGRAWYVLETAIQDHRFGDTTPTSPASEPPLSTWESPRYEAASAEVLPSVNRLRDEETNGLQESWHAWFNNFDSNPPVLQEQAGETIAPVITPPEPEMPEIKEDEEVVIPIHTIYQLPPEELLPSHRLESEREQPIQQEEREEEPRVKRSIVMPILQLVGALVAVIFAATAVIGSGYFDTYILSNRQVGIIAGVTLYNR